MRRATSGFSDRTFDQLNLARYRGAIGDRTTILGRWKDRKGRNDCGAFFTHFQEGTRLKITGGPS